MKNSLGCFPFSKKNLDLSWIADVSFLDHQGGLVLNIFFVLVIQESRDCNIVCTKRLKFWLMSWPMEQGLPVNFLKIIVK